MAQHVGDKGKRPCIEEVSGPSNEIVSMKEDVPSTPIVRSDETSGLFNDSVPPELVSGGYIRKMPPHFADFLTKSVQEGKKYHSKFIELNEQLKDFNQQLIDNVIPHSFRIAPLRFQLAGPDEDPSVQTALEEAYSKTLQLILRPSRSVVSLCWRIRLLFRNSESQLHAQKKNENSLLFMLDLMNWS